MTRKDKNKIDKWALFVFFICQFAFFDSISIASDKNIDPNCLSNKIRAGFVAIFDKELLPLMSENGLNAVLVKYKQIHAPLTKSQKATILEWAQACKKSKLQYLPTLNYWSEDEMRWISLRYHYYHDGKEFPRMPCSFDEDVYQKSIHDRVLEMAYLSKEVPIAGVVFNTELFFSEHNLYPGLCFCDHCWNLFNMKADYPEIPASLREEFIKRNNIYKLYTDTLEAHLVTLCRNTRKEVNKINSHFIIGFGGLDKSNPFHDALARGFASKGNPVYVFSRESYQKGYTNEIQRIQQSFRDKGIFIRYIPGIWQDTMPVQQLPAQYYYCAKASDGYWVYTLQSLNPKQKFSLNNSRERYWEAIREANDELDQLQNDSDYITNLQVGSFSNLMPPVSVGEITLPELYYINPNFVDSQIKPLQIRGQNLLVFKAEKNELINFIVQYDLRIFRKATTDYATMELYSCQGDVLGQRRISFNQKGVIKIKAPYSGTYGILLHSDIGTTLTIEDYTHPFSIDARKSTLYFPDPFRKFYFYKPAGVREIHIRIEVHNTNEKVKVILRDENDSILFQDNIVGRYDLSRLVRNPSSKSIYMLEIPEVNYRIRPYIIVKPAKGLSPYISLYSHGLLRSIGD